MELYNKVQKTHTLKLTQWTSTITTLLNIQQTKHTKTHQKNKKQINKKTTPHTNPTHSTILHSVFTMP